MEIIRSLPSEEEIETLLKILNISIDNIDKTDTLSVARGVLEVCKSIMPKEFIELCDDTGNLESFLKDTISYLVFNTYQLETLHKDNKDETKPQNYKHISNTIKKLNTIEHREKLSGEYNREIQNYQKILANSLGDYFNLEKVYSVNEKSRKSGLQIKLPKTVAPFILFIVTNYEFHKRIKSKKGVKSLDEIYETLASFKGFLSSSQDDKEINAYHFEKEYSIFLSFEILTSLREGRIENITNGLKILGLLSMLPNIKGRIHLVKVFLSSMKPKTTKLENEEVGSFIPKILSPSFYYFSEYEWCENTSEIIVHLALITFPLIEILHWYIIKKFRIESTPLRSYYILDNTYSNIRIDLDSFAELQKYIQNTQKTFQEYNLEKLILKKSKIEANGDGSESYKIYPYTNLIMQEEAGQRIFQTIVDEYSSLLLNAVNDD